jgi:hypothetical protein
MKIPSMALGALWHQSLAGRKIAKDNIAKGGRHVISWQLWHLLEEWERSAVRLQHVQLGCLPLRHQLRQRQAYC